MMEILFKGPKNGKLSVRLEPGLDAFPVAVSGITGAGVRPSVYPSIPGFHSHIHLKATCIRNNDCFPLLVFGVILL